MFLSIGVCLALASLSWVDCLTCLHCTDIESPRHCKHVMECPSGQVCHIHQTTNTYGEVFYYLGCTETSTCSNRSHGSHACDECCSTDLCNAARCGEPGYPPSRGPICYSCSAPTTVGSCHRIDFCGTNEVCMISEEREFGDTVYESQCAVLAQCENHKAEVAPIIGRSISDDTRSVTETMCHKCCHWDLCNAHCSTKVDYCASNPCVHGRCVNDRTDYTCVCDSSYIGHNCSEVDYCASNPCVHGRCVNGTTDYACVCDPLYTGHNCSDVDYCAINPCVHGRCVNNKTDYTCVCDPFYYGHTCSEMNHCASNPCVHGTCINGRTQYTCVCDLFYTGHNCTEIDHCASNPCVHGTCINGRTEYSCVCDLSYTGHNCTEYVKDCLDLRNFTQASGVYMIQPERAHEIIEVYCDMTTDGGGWTVFQRRVNGSVDFYQNFHSYENGFGNVHGEFWLGLKYLHRMTSQTQSELRIDLMAADGSRAYEVFSNFRLSAAPNYTLHIGAGHGTAGDSDGMGYNNGFRFATYDTNSSCATYGHGGWWYGACTNANLNGKYGTPGTQAGGASSILYFGFKRMESLKETQMMFRTFKYG